MIVRHQFTAHDAVVTADTLQAFAISLVPFSVYLYVMRAFYALQDTRTPFLLNAFENGLNVVLAIVLFPRFGVQGLALAWSGAYLVAAGRRARRPAPPDRRRPRRRPRSDRRSAPASRRWRWRVVAAPVAGAIGRSSPAEALLATVVAGGAGIARVRRRCSCSCAPTSSASLVDLVAAARPRPAVPDV